jgi:hypothetical protein
MNAHPLLMSSPNPTLIVKGLKRMTRRTTGLEEINQKPDAWTLHSIGDLGLYAKPSAKGKPGAYFHSETLEPGTILIAPVVCPYGRVGDSVWMRESLYCKDGTWYYKDDDAPVEIKPEDQSAAIVWAHHKSQDYAPSIHAPRFTSRISRTLTDIRLERLLDISEEDALAEGIEVTNILEATGKKLYGLRDKTGKLLFIPQPSARRAYIVFFDVLHGQGTASANPWVWALGWENS